MKKSIFLFFAAILCAIGMNAANLTGGTVLYLKPNSNWTSDNAWFAMYLCNGSSAAEWVRMTLVEGETNVYTATVPAGKTHKNVIFCRMNKDNKTMLDWSNKWNQSGDLTWDGTKNCCAIKDGQWDCGTNVTWSVYTPKVTHTFTKNSTLYVDFRAITDKKGANYPKAGTASGLDYSANAGGTVIPITFTADVKWTEGAEFMKTEKGGWTSISFKAPAAGQNCAQVAADGKSYTWTTYTPAAPEPDPVYTVVGSSAPLFGVAWATGKVENDMTLVEGTKYELVKSDIALTVGEIQYKVAVNHAWDEAYPGENAILNISEAGKYTVTFTFDSNTKAVNATAELKEAAVVLPTVGVKGAWDGWAATTTLTGDNTSASATVNIATAGIYEFGLDVDGNFQASGATIDKANNSTVVTTNAGNMKLKANVLGDYTFTWTYETNTLTVTYPAGEEVDLNKYYVIGLSGNWDIVPANELVPVSVGSKEYSLVANMTAGIHEFKVSDATKDNTYGYAELTKKNYNELSEGEYSNIKLTLAANAEVTITFNGETKAITLTSTALTENTAALTYTVTVPAGTAKCYICGAWDWNTFMEMTPTANANEFTIDIVGATASQEYKYTCGQGWEYAEVNADGSTRANRTYNANDVVERWADVITYVLMGVNGDWTTGIQLTKNSETEYMLLGQTITRNTDKIKVVTLTNGTATAWCGNVDTYSDAIYENDWDDAGNIVLEDGIYDFYFKVSEDKIYIDQTTLLRTGTNKYGTIYVPYTPASVSGATFYQVAGKGTENGTAAVYLESVNTIEAGKPYIYERTGNQVVKIEFSGSKATNGGAVNGLVGTDATTTDVAPGHYLLYNNAFCKSDGSSKVRGYRAYLVMENITGGKPSQMPGRRYIGMAVEGENAETGFENIVAPEGETKKVLINGQLIIIRDGEMYNAQGQRL